MQLNTSMHGVENDVRRIKPHGAVFHNEDRARRELVQTMRGDLLHIKDGYEMNVSAISYRAPSAVFSNNVAG